MDSDKAEQHHVQRDDGHEQNDENPQSGRDERQEHSCVVDHDAEERHDTPSDVNISFPRDATGRNMPLARLTRGLRFSRRDQPRRRQNRLVAPEIARRRRGGGALVFQAGRWSDG
jgi:hypothetical protein